MIGRSVVNNSFLVFNAFWVRAPLILLCGCSVCVAWKITETQRLCDPGPKHGENRGKIRIAFCPWGTLYGPSLHSSTTVTLAYHLSPQLDTGDRFGSCPSQVTFEILTKEVTNLKAVQGCSRAPSSLYISTGMGTSSGPDCCLPFT